jgi:hypothetical protein
MSLLSIASSEDLDKYARKMRETMLSALSQVLAFIASSHSLSSIEERKAFLNLVLQLLLQLCQDLDSSFDGLSGGIQTRLFLSFLDTIDKCVDAIVALFESMPTIAQRQIGISFASVHQASVIIWELFCENTLRVASVIKGALRVCIDKIPRMIVKVERVIDECITSKTPCEQICEILHQCSAQLMSKQINEAEEAPVITTPSDEIDNIGAKCSLSCLVHIKGGEVKRLPSSKEMSKGWHPNADGERPPECKDRQVQMPIVSSKTLMWVYNSAFGAFTNIWNDSYRIISGRVKMKRHMVKSPQEKSLALASRRIIDFSHLHTSICRLFGERMISKDETVKNGDADSGDSTTILAELLSYQQKAKLCSSLEKMAMTLTLALKRVIKYFKECTPLTFGQKPFDECKLNESLICIIGWLHSVKATDAKFNLITGCLRWRANERRIFSLPPFKNDNDDGGESYTILGRLPKVLLRLEGLEAELQELNNISAECKRRNKISIERWLILDRAASALMNGASALEEPGDLGEMLRRCIQILDEGKDGMKSNVVDRDILSDEDDFYEDLERNESSSLAGKRRRQRLCSYARKSRRVPLRSRNETVDDWLAMDDDEFGSAPGEKYNANDAFVDLEDFLVEG